MASSETVEMHPTTDPRIACSVCDRSASVVCVEKGETRLFGRCEEHAPG